MIFVAKTFYKLLLNFECQKFHRSWQDTIKSQMLVISLQCTCTCVYSFLKTRNELQV